MLIKENNEILVATILSRLKMATELAEHAYATTGIRSVISCQTYEQAEYKSEAQVTTAFSLYFTDTKGLSVNRNHALSKAKAKYVWFLDDDVRVIPEGCCKAFEFIQHNEFDTITTSYVIEDGRPRKKYSAYPFTHNKFSIMKVSSIEIFCDREALLKHKIEFDSQFGLGAFYTSGEENILLARCLDAGLKVGYQPIITSSHPDETSGGVYENTQQLVSKGAIIRKIFGLWGFPLVVAFFLKRFKNRELSLQKTGIAIMQGYKGFCSVQANRK